MLVTQSHLTLHNPMNCSPPGSTVHGILQARVLERLPLLLQVIFPTQRPGSPALQADSLLSEPSGEPILGYPREISILLKIYHSPLAESILYFKD